MGSTRSTQLLRHKVQETKIDEPRKKIKKSEMKQYLENIARYFTILALNLTLIATIPLQGIRYFNQADKNQKPAHIFNLLTIIFASINIFYSTIWGNITKHKNSYCLAITKYYNPIFYLLSC